MKGKQKKIMKAASSPTLIAAFYRRSFVGKANTVVKAEQWLPVRRKALNPEGSPKSQIQINRFLALTNGSAALFLWHFLELYVPFEF